MDNLVKAIYDFTLRGGKRLRALLILIGYWSREWGKDLDKILPVMAGIEFLQSYLLVHDDIMDQDELRRGGPTLHVWFERECRQQDLIGDCKHYGISQAITSGDYLEALAIATILSAPLPHETVRALVNRYSRGLRTVSYGQFLDVLLSYKPLDKISENDILKVHELKTASYTVELPLHLGVIAANPNDQVLLNVFSMYSKPAGIAFQLRDDIIGLYGNSKITGKPVGSDVREKKKTLLVVKAYELGSNNDRKFLKRIYDELNRDEITINDIMMVQDIVKETGSLKYNEDLIKKFYEESIKIIDVNRDLITNEAYNVLKSITYKLSYRSY